MPIAGKYQDLIKNEVNFTGKIAVGAESRGIRKNVPILITEGEDIKSLLGMNWPLEFIWTIRHIEKTMTITYQSEMDNIFTDFEKLFKTNGKNQNIKIKIKLGPRHPPIKQKVRPLTYHLQSYVSKK